MFNEFRKLFEDFLEDTAIFIHAFADVLDAIVNGIITILSVEIPLTSKTLQYTILAILVLLTLGCASQSGHCAYRNGKTYCQANPDSRLYVRTK